MSIGPLFSAGFVAGAQSAQAEIERLTAENERLWNVLSWIDTFDPETTAAAEGKFGLDLQRRAFQQQAVKE